MVSLVKRLFLLLAMVAIVVGACCLAWWIADDPDEAQVTSSVAVGVAIVIVTWIYTRHTRDMAVQMRDESRRARTAERALRVGAIENIITELVELSSFIDSQLRANEDNTVNQTPYPDLHLLTIDSYFAVVVGLSTGVHGCRAAMSPPN